VSPTATDSTVPCPIPGDFNIPLVDLRIATAVKTAKGRWGVLYGKWTADLSFRDSRKEVSGTDHRQTIHTRGAVHAAVGALASLKRRCAVEIYTDSTYLLQGATTWFPLGLSFGWAADGDKPGRMRNYELWSQLRDLAARHDIHWHGPRSLAIGEFGSVMPEQKMEMRRRTVGDGPDAGHIYAGHVLPWDDSLGEYRAFDDGELQNPEICVNVGSTDDNAITPLTAGEKAARKRVIARIAKHYRPEFIKKAVPRGRTVAVDTPGDIIHSIALTPESFDYLQNAFQSLTETSRKTDATVPQSLHRTKTMSTTDTPEQNPSDVIPSPEQAAAASQASSLNYNPKTGGTTPI
jgi:ribonuclease HI